MYKLSYKEKFYTFLEAVEYTLCGEDFYEISKLEKMLLFSSILSIPMSDRLEYLQIFDKNWNLI